MTPTAAQGQALTEKLEWIIAHNRTYYMGAQKNAAVLAQVVLRYRKAHPCRCDLTKHAGVKCGWCKQDAKLAKALGLTRHDGAKE
jgi:hypothetical protein